MKRRAIQIGVLLLLGAIINVAVAWGTAMGFGLPASASRSEQVTGGDYPIVRLVKSTGLLGITVSLEDKIREPDLARVQVWSLRSGAPFRALLLIRQPDTYQTHGNFAIPLDVPPTSINEGYVLPSTLLPSMPAWRRTVPAIPLCPGFAINTIFYAAVMWMVFAFPFVIRRRRRIKRGLCPACAYPVGTSPVCTECGSQLVPSGSETQ